MKKTYQMLITFYKKAGYHLGTIGYFQSRVPFGGDITI
jgi:hypothetical protein